ncbi:RmlC-like cupins superfamily protein [Actinidia rufa]|uniref:Germin-like protein n=1 Tax=Actinidia rufa TaxID=165716 RepID=A0A7J0G5E5_9ERIC|nr:RmlC-like cupins superfamily protein [Actinidia rufa]
MSFVRADFGPGGVNVPHFHPRATETAFVLEGKIYSGFVDSQNRVFAKVIEKGEVMVFPKGLVHFQMNVGDSQATILGSFNSQNPGLVRIPNTVFGSGIEEELLEKAFWVEF